jgi:hypothetical protein
VTGVCSYCARLKRLNGEGLVPLHMLTIPVSAKAIHAVGSRRVRRRCPGSGKAPRRVES